jgi:hypothetical protein
MRQRALNTDRIHNALKRNILVRQCLPHHRLHTPNKTRNIRTTGQVNPQRQRVHEEPHQIFAAPRHPARNRRPDHNLVLTRKTTQKTRKATQQNTKQRRPKTVRNTLKRPGLLSAKPHLNISRTASAIRSAFMITGKIQKLRRSLQLTNPVTHLTLELAVTAGPSLLVGGQTEDMGGLAAGADPDRLEFILRGKTAAMLSASFAMGALVGGAASAEVEAFRRAGRSAGIAFQLVDDLLDLTSDSVQMGKPVGADAQNNKLTYAGLFGVPAAQARVAALTNEAIALLLGTRGDTAFLVELIGRLAARRN